jgi:hypothetical protein
MSRKKAKETVENGAEATGLPEASAYLKRLVDDAELRDTLGRAVEASRRVYERLGKTRKPGKLLDDEKLQADVQEAIDAFRNAAAGLAQAPREGARKGRRFGRKLVILGLGGALALAGSEGLRSKVLDALFGAEEEFEYTPPPADDAPPPPPPPPADEPPPPPADDAPPSSGAA